MKVWLLTHSEELKKTTGTGALVKHALGTECEIIEWSRLLPNEAITNLSPKDTILIYPCNTEESSFSHNNVTAKNIIIIDGTWQQARKIYNQSPYLKTLPHREIKGVKSIYSKRRNQKSTGLCTAEVTIHILTEQKHPAAPNLMNAFLEFNQ